MLRALANGEAFVSATMCPRLPGPRKLALKMGSCKLASTQKIIVSHTSIYRIHRISFIALVKR